MIKKLWWFIVGRIPRKSDLGIPPFDRWMSILMRECRFDDDLFFDGSVEVEAKKTEVPNSIYMPISPRIKPCPKCGKVPRFEIEETYYSKKRRYGLICNCERDAYVVGDSVDECVAMWNAISGSVMNQEVFPSW